MLQTIFYLIILILLTQASYVVWMFSLFMLSCTDFNFSNRHITKAKKRPLDAFVDPIMILRLLLLGYRPRLDRMHAGTYFFHQVRRKLFLQRLHVEWNLV